MTIYLKNLTVELRILYDLNMYVEFRVDRILFTIRSLNYFLFIILDY